MYEATKLDEIIEVDSIFTIHYFEYDKDFKFEGEKHPFWEFVYVDNGCANILANDQTIKLNSNEIIFHEPNELHSVEANHQSSLDLVVISFSSESKILDFFKHKKLILDETEKNILNQIIIEARHLFSSPLNDPYTKKMIIKENAPIGASQLIKIYLEQFLIHILRRYNKLISDKPISKINDEQLVLKKVISYLNANLGEKLTVNKIADDNLINKIRLQNIFKKELNTTIIDYFNYLKIKEAKRLIRNGSMNFSQISNQLGYSSIHYFSNQFKKVTSLTPTNYAKSIKALNDKNQNN